MGVPVILIDDKVVVSLAGEIKELQIVGSAEVNARAGKISYLSPIGEALLGRQVGESFEVCLPSGKKLNCEVKEIK